MRWPVLLMLAACSPRHWRDDPAKPPDGVIAKLAIASGTHVRFLDLSAHGIMADRDVDVGKYVTKLVWMAAEPAVTLADSDPAAPPYTVPPTVAFGTVGGDGFHAFPSYAWPAAASGEGVIDLHELVAHAGGTWEGVCTTGIHADGEQICAPHAWTWVRRQPMPEEVSHDELDDAAAPSPPTLVPPLKVDVDKRDGYSGKVDYLRCTDGTGHAATIPDAVETPGEFLGMSKPIWLASEPPIFSSGEGYLGMTTVERPHIYVDCREDGNLDKWTASDSGMVAIYGHRLDVVYRGKVIATADGGNAVAFAPSASAPPAR